MCVCTQKQAIKNHSNYHTSKLKSHLVPINKTLCQTCSQKKKELPVNLKTTKHLMIQKKAVSETPTTHTHSHTQL